MRTIESLREKIFRSIHLKLRPRLRLPLAVMALFLVLAAAAGAWLGYLHAAHRQQLAEAAGQLLKIEALQQTWTELNQGLDQVLITRQAALIDTHVNELISRYDRQALDLQVQELGLAPGSRLANSETARELSFFSSRINETTAEMARAAREDRWVSYAWLRHTQLKPLDRQVNTVLAQLTASLRQEMTRVEAHAPTLFGSYYLFAALALVGLVAAGALDLFLGTTIYHPLKSIAARVQQVNQGSLERYQPLDQPDELGALSQTLAAMIEHMRTLVSDLEAQVVSRTQGLERRGAQLQVSAQVARDIASTRDLPSLLAHAVNLIRDHFGYYHAGIFLLDQAGEYAVLRAATGEAGREMLNRGHQLKVGETGLVGYATRRGEARIALDVGADVTHFRNPLLPDTRSEMALPLKVGEAVIGALDVQSVEPAAFGPDDITVLQSLADQIAVAIENVRLVERLQKSLAELEAFYGQRRRQVWEQFAASRSVQGYRYDQSGTAPIEADEAEVPAQGESGAPIHIPLQVRGASIGALEVWPENSQLSHSDRALLEHLASRISQAMESARLFEEAQARAVREQVINQVSANISRSMDLDSLLQTAVRELGQIPQVLEVSVHVGPPDLLAGEHIQGTGES
jgi:GAF domain-containing protein/HAMP domain-containing protein